MRKTREKPKNKSILHSARIEQATFRVWGERDNHYTMSAAYDYDSAKNYLKHGKSLVIKETLTIDLVKIRMRSPFECQRAA